MQGEQVRARERWVRGGQGRPSEEVTSEQRPGGSEGWRLFETWGKQRASGCGEQEVSRR